MSSPRRSAPKVAVLAVVASVLALYAGDLFVRAAASSALVTVAEFDFDDGLGGPDAQGWRPLHRFQSEQAYFHVEDFSGAGHLAAPLEGSRSMWCGLTAEDPRTCHWSAPPGYGSNWNENLVSNEFAVQGDVTLDYIVDMSLETSYDFVYVEYEDSAGAWTLLDTYDCGFQVCGPVLKSYTVPATFHDGNLRFRFHFDSDPIGDQENNYLNIFQKAFLIDSLTVTDATGTVDYQDFESEALGDSVTTDGDWLAEPNTDAYNGGALVDGTGVLQESVGTNDTFFWAFYNGSTRDYGCAGHAEQLVVPETRNLVRSPHIDLTHDADGNPIDGDVDSVEVSFDVYRDIYFSQQKWYRWMIRTYSDDCLLDANEASGLAQGDQKDWYRHSVVFSPTAGTTAIEIDLGVQNSNFGGEQCRSHAPLFDNVTVKRFGGVVTAANDPVAPARLVLRQNWPNPFNPTTTITYEVPAGAGRVTLRVYDVSGRLVRMLVDRLQPAGSATATWDGSTNSGAIAPSGVYFYRLSAGDASKTRRMVLLK
jgi:hypothetical protein